MQYHREMHLRPLGWSLFGALVAIGSGALVGCGASEEPVVVVSPPPAAETTSRQQSRHRSRPERRHRSLPRPTAQPQRSPSIRRRRSLPVKTSPSSRWPSFHPERSTSWSRRRASRPRQRCRRATVFASQCRRTTRHRESATPSIFLHGATCDYTSATTLVGIEDRAPISDVIVVMPEAGKFGFYNGLGRSIDRPEMGDLPPDAAGAVHRSQSANDRHEGRSRCQRVLDGRPRRDALRRRPS